MDGRGTPLRTWEKAYWGVFVTAISLFLFNRLRPDPQAAQVTGSFGELDSQHILLECFQLLVAKERMSSNFVINRCSLFCMPLQIDEDKEARKMEAARAVLAGRSFTEGEEDPFEGLGPQEIQAYIDKALQGVTNSDPFEVSL